MDANSLFYTEKVNPRIVSNYNKAQLDQENNSNSKDTWTVQKIFYRVYKLLSCRL